MANILVIDDDVTFASLIERFLSRHQHTVTLCHTLAGAGEQLNDAFHIVFLDLRLPDGDGASFLSKIKTKYPELPVVIMTNYADVSSAVATMKKGAFDYIAKPFQQEAVLNVIANATANNEQSSQQVTAPKKTAAKTTSVSNEFVTGISNTSRKLVEHINLVAPTDMSVLITGKSGTGKEVVAKSIHLKSNRKNHPFIAVDCGAIPKEIASSEFFGHIKGSFTGAVTDKKGHFEEANHGTIFLDEVGNLSYENQVQLLRALQERKIKPVGSSKEIDVDIRVLAATNENLLEAVEKGEFREDLYHRLNEFFIKVPSLIDRMEDLMIFADFFLERANKQLHKNVIGFTKDAISVLQQYHWPGNLRELQNVIKRSVLLTQGDYVTEAVLPNELAEPVETYTAPTYSTKANEKALIIAALEKTNYNKTLAAKLLNVSRKTLYNKLKFYELDASQ